MRRRGHVGFEPGKELQALSDQSPYCRLAGCYRSVHEKRRKFQDLDFGGGRHIRDGEVV